MRKLDPKVRFQNSTFKNQLQKARNYKRPISNVHEKGEATLLEKVGLSSLWSQAIIVLALITVIYLIYVPNFLYIKEITVHGLNDEQAKNIQTISSEYFKKRSIWPQRNLLLLSKSDLTHYIQANDPTIYSLKKLDKKFPNGLVIEAEPHIDTYIITTPSRKLVAYQDSIIHQELPFTSTSVPETVTTGITFTSEQEAKIGDKILDGQIMDTFSQLSSVLNHLSLAVQYFEMEKPNGPDISSITTSGYKIVTNRTIDETKLATKLGSILAEIKPGDQHNIYYIDLRMETRAFVCFKSEKCVKNEPDPIPIETTTSTPSTTATTSTSSLSTLKK